MRAKQTNLLEGMKEYPDIVSMVRDLSDKDVADEFEFAMYRKWLSCYCGVPIAKSRRLK